MQDFHRYLQGRNSRWGHFGQVDEAVHRGQSGGIRNDGVVGGLGGACTASTHESKSLTTRVGQAIAR